VFGKARVIHTLGNRAVHSHRPVPEGDALAAVRELFHVAYWFARSYGRAGRPAPGLAFDAAALPRPARAAAQTAEQLQALEARLREQDENLAALLADKTALDGELKRLRAEVAEAKRAAAAQPDTHDYSEAETRDTFIDLLLEEAGCALDQPRDREFEVGGMPNAEGKGFVDYVLWGGDGRPLGLVEAKRTRRDARAGQQQAKLYADCSPISSCAATGPSACSSSPTAWRSSTRPSTPSSATCRTPRPSTSSPTRRPRGASTSPPIRR
jgi:type I restriction enzyme R subunit